MTETSEQPEEQTESEETTRFDPSRPPAPAMSQDEVGKAWDALCRIPCELERHCLYADVTWPSGYDDPATAVREAAGCPDRCLCTLDVTPAQAAVDAVATTVVPPTVLALAGHGLQLVGPMTAPGDVADQPPIPTTQLQAHVGLENLAALEVPDGPPLSERSIVSLGGGMAPAPLGLDMATFTIVDTEPEEPVSE